MARVTRPAAPRAGARPRRRLRILISAGPTRERIDPVRYLSNDSTGYMGLCLAAEARRRGHRVTMVLGPIALPVPRGIHGIRVIDIESAVEMRQALARQLRQADVLIMAAAVCDFQPESPSRQKLPRTDRLELRLRGTPDVVGSLPRRPGQVFIGFALETDPGIERATNKLRSKRLDAIIGQHMGPQRNPFGERPVQAFILDASGARKLGQISKPKLAGAVLDKAESLWYDGVPPRRRERTGAGTIRGRPSRVGP